MQSCLRYTILFSAIFFYSSFCGAQSLDTTLASWEQNSVFDGSIIGLSVRDLSNDKLIYEHNGDVNLCPASSLKAVTTGIALNRLGPSYTFRTSLSLTVMNGDTCLVIKGSGDPTMGSMRFFQQENAHNILHNLVDGLLDLQGVMSIKRIYIDRGNWPTNPIPVDYGHEDLGKYYGAVAHSINLNENVLRAYLQREKSYDQPWSLQLVPNIHTTLDTIIYEVQDSSASSLALIYPMGTSSMLVCGKMRHGYWRMRIESALHNPESTALSILKEKLTSLGNKTVEIGGNFQSYQHNIIDIVNYESPTLDSIAHKTNTWSVNVFADGLMKNLMIHDNLSSPQEVVKEYAQDYGINKVSYRITDGSGLSRSNIISTNLMTRLINSFAEHQPYSDFQNSLAILGGEGTLETLVSDDSPAKGRVFAKSGGLTGVLSYTGIVQTNQGKWLSFSLIMNHHVAKNELLRKYMSDFFESLIEL